MEKILLVAFALNLLLASPAFARDKFRIYDEKSRFVGYITESGRIYDKDSRFRGTIQGDRIYDEKSQFKGTIKEERSGKKERMPYLK